MTTVIGVLFLAMGAAQKGQRLKRKRGAPSTSGCMAEWDP